MILCSLELLIRYINYMQLHDQSLPPSHCRYDDRDNRASGYKIFCVQGYIAPVY